MNTLNVFKYFGYLSQINATMSAPSHVEINYGFIEQCEYYKQSDNQVLEGALEEDPEDEDSVDVYELNRCGK